MATFWRDTLNNLRTRLFGQTVPRENDPVSSENSQVASQEFNSGIGSRPYAGAPIAEVEKNIPEIPVPSIPPKALASDPHSIKAREPRRPLTPRSSAASRPAVQKTQRQPKLTPIGINLGIDFGTSYTKISFRDVGAEKSAIVTFGAKSAEDAILPSVVHISPEGQLTIGDNGSPLGGAIEVRYLKMRLADVSAAAKVPPFQGHDLNKPIPIQALSCWYLAKIIKMSQDWLVTAEEKRFVGRQIRWSANVGVPVEQFDSPSVKTFRTVLAISFDWAKRSSIPETMAELLQSYNTSRTKVKLDETDCHAVPEIAAAVASFVNSRQATPDFYIYFDIGGGTIDGVAFRYFNFNGSRGIDFYSAQVKPLGVAEIAAQVSPKNFQETERRLLKGEVSASVLNMLLTTRSEVQKLVGYVVMTAKKLDGRNWQREAIQSFARRFIKNSRLDTSKMRPLIVFLGGGGASSPWYHQAIFDTYRDFQHVNAGVPPYQLEEVPLPDDCNLYSMSKKSFRRFAIAYGLSIPFGEGVEITLPGDRTSANNANNESPSYALAPKGSIDYGDSKDALD